MALAELRQREPALRARGVRALYLFGSMARNTATARSDLDLVFEYDPASRFSLFTQADLVAELSEGLGRPVDLIAMEGLRAGFRNRIADELVRVF